MKIRTRLLLVLFVLIGLGFYQFVRVIIQDIRPRYLATMEESMVETATLLASLVSSQLVEEDLPLHELDAMVDMAKHWDVIARIYEMDKSKLNLRVYVADASGIVVYDSNDPSAVGEDYSLWNDVYLTLRGRYGARATRADPEDPQSSVLYVAAPIMKGDEIKGVLTVAKPAASIERFHRTAKESIIRYGMMVAVFLVLTGIAVTYWITRPIETLTTYARAVRDGGRPTPPRLGRSDMGQLAESFEEMRDALEGKTYVENYIETLTHEMKSPLSVIKGAAELLEEDMPPEQQRRFMGNILSETIRIQTLVDRLLELSALERKKDLRKESVNMQTFVHTCLDAVSPQLEVKQLSLETTIDEVDTLEGERFLLEQAVRNLLQNAIEFSPSGHQVNVTLSQTDSQVLLTVFNSGTRIPDFAFERMFERFYSLARPDTGRRSSGIGLTLVREVAGLHGGEIALKNEGEGVVATLRLPLD